MVHNFSVVMPSDICTRVYCIDLYEHLSHPMANNNSLLDQVYVRQELWKYRRVFDGYEKRWMSTPFKKLDINLISTKVKFFLEF